MSFLSSVYKLNNAEGEPVYSYEPKLELKFEYNIELKKYVEIKVTGEDQQKIEPHIIEYCSSSSSDSRIQLSSNLNLVNFLWLTKEQIGKDDYIKVTCPVDECSYTLEVNTYDVLKLDINKDYTYYVSKGNQEMTFNLINLLTENSDDSYFKIWVIGSKDINVDIEGGVKIDGIEEKGMFMANYKQSNDIIITVTATIGDLITIGSSKIEKTISKKALELNGAEIYGYLYNETNNNEICYPIDISRYNLDNDEYIYITAKVFNDIGVVYFLNIDDGTNQDLSTITSAGISYKLRKNEFTNLAFCFKFPSSDFNTYYEIDKVIYELRLSYTKDLKYSSLIYKPQRLGEFYQRTLHKGSIVAFIGAQPEQGANRIEYTMQTTSGFPDMFFTVCNNYPFCFYDDDNLTNLIDPHNINSMSSYSVNYTDDISPISPKQNVLIVKCTEGASKSGKEQQDESEANKNICEFNTLIFSNKDKIKLIESHMLNQYILENEIDEYTIAFEQMRNVFKLYVDLMIYSGDVILEQSKDEEGIHKYQAANKIFYSIKLNGKENEYNFSVIGKKNSFYSIEYSLIYDDDKDSPIKIMPFGINYLVTIEPKESDGVFNNGRKIMHFNNIRTIDKHPFYINFYSLNCKIEINKPNYDGETEVNLEPLQSRDYYFSQDIIEPSDDKYNLGQYIYYADILSNELEDYDKQLCMLYVSNIELETEGKSVERQILVSENVMQKTIFEKGNKVMKYIYVIPNVKNNIAVKFNLIEKAEYNVTFYIDRALFRNINVTNNQQETLEATGYAKNCKQLPSNQPCSLIIEIELLKEIQEDPSLEIAVKSIGIEKYPSYLIKNKVNNDYLSPIAPSYFYTDIGKGTYGEVIINYYRGFGTIYGKIVKKTQNIPDSKPEWRGIYEFPSTVKGTLRYASYLRRLSFTEEDTSDCEEGCYLLLTVQNSVSSDINMSSRNFGFDIIIKTKTSAYPYTTPIIQIPLDDYIIGNIFPQSSEKLKTYYIVYLPYDAEKVVFDFQSEYASFYVNLNINERFLPAEDGYDWKFNSFGKPNLYEISKQQIINIADQNDIDIETLEGLSMIIGVWAENTDNIFTTVYSIKVHLSLEEDLNNIYEVYSDQQTLCNSTEIKDNPKKYRCLYVVKYDKNNKDFDLLIHPILRDQSIDYSMYANFIPKTLYDLNKFDDLEKYIPNSKSVYSTDITREESLLIDLNKGDKNGENYVFVSVETDKPTTVNLLTTFSTFDYTSSPNPSTPQLYIIARNSLEFTFSSYDDFIINFVSLNNSGQIYWEDEMSKNVTHTIRGRDDRLSLTSPHSTEDGMKYTKLIIKNLNPVDSMSNSNDNAFIFYATYYLRSSQVNFDELVFGKTFNINYRETDFPITVYTKIDTMKKDLNAFINIFVLESEDRYSREEDEFKVYAWILKDSIVFNIKKNQVIMPNKDDAIIGVYDPAKRVCLISLKSEDMLKYNVNENEIPNLAITIDKNSESSENRKYNRISLEGTVIQDDSLVPITEKVYQYGKLKKDTEDIVYKLKTDRKQSITFVIFSSNSELLDFSVSKDENSEKVFNYEKKNINGKVIVNFNSEPDKYNYIYLKIFTKDKNKVKDERLTNYAFKYVNVNDTKYMYNYEVAMDIDYSQDTLDHIIKVQGIVCQKCEVQYYVKFYSRNHLIEGEKFDTIAVTESKGIVEEYEGPINMDDGKVKFHASGIKFDIAYIQVIAHVNDGPINEFLSYKSKYLNEVEPENNEKDDDNDKKFIIALSIISVICLIIIIAFGVFCYKKNKETKDLMDKVNKISFQGDREESQDDNLLIK